MVVIPKKLSWVQMLFHFRGSIVLRIRLRLAAATVWAILVDLFFEHLYELPEWMSLSIMPFQLIGLAMAICLGFRNNTSYDRFWEGRKLWGALVNTTRSLTRQTLTLMNAPAEEADALAEEQRAQVYRLIGYVHSFRHRLREEDTLEELERYLPAAEREALVEERNRPVAILQTLGDRYAEAWRRGWIDTFHLPIFERSLEELTNIQGGCERILATPIPFAYNVLMHRIVAVYCFALPFGILKSLGDLMPLVVFMISYSFLGLDAIGDEIEEPFGTDPNDLPLTALSRMIEVNLRQRLGEEDLPPLMKPDANDVLL